MPKIEEVVYAQVVFVTFTDLEDPCEFIRYGPSSWSARYANSDESVYDCDWLEAAYQNFIKTGEK